jgi:hypothetical protein
LAARAGIPEKIFGRLKDPRSGQIIQAVKYLSPAEAEGYAKERDVLGYDPYACALTDSIKKSIRALNRYKIEQGLVKKELPLETLFVKEAF